MTESDKQPGWRALHFWGICSVCGEHSELYRKDGAWRPRCYGCVPRGSLPLPEGE